MKTPLPKNLYQIVNLAAGSLVKKAVKKNSFIVNDVPQEVQIAVDEKVVSKILNNLLAAIVFNSTNGCIKVKANEYDDIIWVSIKDNGCFDNMDILSNMAEVQLLAKTLNGNVSVRNLENKFTAILLSFPNLPVA